MSDLDKDYLRLEARVNAWAANRGIYAKATPYAQADKTLEEVDELIAHVSEQQAVGDNEHIKEKIADDLGDILVTIIIQAKMQGLNLLDCLDMAVTEIEGREGKMVDGKFVKNG